MECNVIKIKACNGISYSTIGTSFATVVFSFWSTSAFLSGSGQA